MAHLQYLPGDPRLVDQLVYELKSKGIFDQFRKECISDVDTRPAYQNLRQRVETSVSTFLSRQCWKPDLNKNQLREKLRKHILDGNYLEQGVERIVDQVVNPKVASVFIPQVEDLVYNYLGIPRKKIPGPETDKKPEDLLPTDLEAVSPGSVKSSDDKNEPMDTEENEKLDVKPDQGHEEEKTNMDSENKENLDIEMSEVTIKSNDSESMDKSSIPLPAEEIKLENIPAPMNSPPKATKVELDSIALPKEPNVSTDIPLPEETPKIDKDTYFKAIQLHSEDSNSSSDSSLRRNMSPLTPIRNFNNENSYDAQQGFEDDSDSKSNEKTAPSSFRFTIESKETKEINSDSNPEIRKKTDKNNTVQTDLSYQFTNQVNINTYNTPMYDDSSNSNNLRIDYESDVNSKTNIELKPEIDNSLDSKKEKKSDDRKSHKSSHRSRDSSRHSSSKDKRSDSKHSTSRDSSRHDKKSSKDDKIKSKSESDKSKDKNETKGRDSSKHHNHDSSKSSHKSSKDKDSKSHRSSSSSHRHSSKSSDERKSSSSKDKEKTSEQTRDRSKDKPKDSKASSSKSDKDRRSSSSKKSDKDKKKEKKDIDDHYSSSGRGNHSRRSTDRDSNDGSSSSKGSQNHNGTKSSGNKKDSKTSSSKSDNTSTSAESPSPSDKEQIVKNDLKISQFKPIIRVDNHLETPITAPPRLPFVPDVTLKKPKFAANFQEAKKLMKMRKFLDEEQKRMNQEAALLLEFQANVRPSLSQVYSSIPGPELEFACVGTVPDSISYEVGNVEANKNIEEINNDINSESEHSKTAVVEDLQSTNIKDENMQLKQIQENVENQESKQEQNIIKSGHILSQETDDKNDTYDENKPFSELMDEITEYSKASETKTKTDVEEPLVKTDFEETLGKTNIEDTLAKMEEFEENVTNTDIEDTLAKMEDFEESIKATVIQNSGTTEVIGTANSIQNKYFEVTIITEELSESEDTEFEPKKAIEEPIELENTESTENINTIQDILVTKEDKLPASKLYDFSSGTYEDSSENNTDSVEKDKISLETENVVTTEEFTPKILNELQYFAEHEKYNAELERHEFNSFLNNFIENVNVKEKICLVNCDAYEENILKEVASTMGDFEFINYYKNGHLKPNTMTNIVKDVSLFSEVLLPVESKIYEEKSPIFSPVKSECSFELHSDYDTKLDEINKKSRQEVMEIILGSIIDTSPSKMPEVDYYTEPTIENEMENTNAEVKSETENTIKNESLVSEEVKTETVSLKRGIDEVESSVNNNRSVLTPKRVRKLSDSDHISSTTEESEEASNNNKLSTTTRSKYLGRARRVGLPRPKRNNLSNSPSSDKSVENYVQNTPRAPVPNGKIKTTPRSKVQRYDTSDLYKPKLHYLSRRHNVS